MLFPARSVTATRLSIFLFIALSVVSFGVGSSRAWATDSGDRPPNIVLLLTDDHPFDQYGFMGSEVAHTPNIDRLASKSVRFVNGYVPSSVCRPSLGVLLTGLYPHQSGIWFNRAPRDETNRNAAHLVEGLATLPRLLGRHGYKSLQTGKHWEGDYRTGGFDEGTTRYINGKRRFNGVAPDGQKIGRDTLQPIYDFVDRQTAAENPFFVWYGVYLPHAPADAPERYRRLFDGKGLTDYEVAYHANIARLDESIGKLMGYFDRKGLTENTVFLLVSDNGMTIHPDPWWGGPGVQPVAGSIPVRLRPLHLRHLPQP